MPRFFISSGDVRGEDGGRTVTLSGKDALHISRALRMGPGEELTLCDEAGTEYESVIVSAGAEVVVRIRSEKRTENEPPYGAAVYQALVRGDRFDTVVMKATELGASRIVPVMTSRCTVKLAPGDYRKKQERWQRIAAEAAGQCGRGRIPEVAEPVRFADALAEAAQADLPLFCYEGGEGTPTQPLTAYFKDRPQPLSVSVFVGPEGGFEPSEAEQAVRCGMKPAGLGKRILRTETAAAFVLAALSCRYELDSREDSADR